MVKKITDFDINEYVENLLADVDLPDEHVKTLKATLAHDKVAARVKESALMRSDYSRQMDEVTKQQEELEALNRRTREFYEQQQQQVWNNQENYNALIQERDKLRKQLEGKGKPSTGYDDYLDNWGQEPTNGGLSADEFEAKIKALKEEQDEKLASFSRNALKMMSQSTKLAQRHNREFNEELDPEDLYRFSLENELPLEAAYDVMVKSRREEILAERHKKEIEEARKQGEVAALSRHRLPLPDDRPRGIHALKPPKDIPKTHDDRVAAAVNDFMRGGSME